MRNSNPIQFHWRLIQGGEPAFVSRSRQLELDKVALPDLEAQAEFCRQAEKSGIESMLTDMSYGKPDPMLLAGGIASLTNKMKFLVAIRSGMITPTYFAQQVNTFSAMTRGRILLNIVAGHSPDEQAYYGDHLSHDERYARTEEFLEVCNGLWHDEEPVNFKGRYYNIVNGQIRTPFVDSNGRKAPYLFVAGGSKVSRDVAISQGSCWMRLPDIPEKVREDGNPVLSAGKEVGLRMAIIARKSKQEAIDAAYGLIGQIDTSHNEKGKEKNFVRKSDSVMMAEMYEKAKDEWLTPWLWTGAVKTHGAPAIAFVGTPDEISDAIMEYKKAGVTQYIFSGWPKLDEMIFFGREILPLVREKEKNLAYSQA